MNVHVPQWPDLLPTLGSWTSEVRGQLIANQPLDEMTTLRVGGPAQLFFRPVDEADLAFFLKHLPAEIRVTVVGLGSNLLIRDGGLDGVVIRLPAGCRPRALAPSISSMATGCGPAPRCRT
jgi:UDP-N-acetylmuramate dehydrogenase